MEKFRLGRVQAIGLFVLLTLIATFAVVNFLRGEDIFKRSTTYYSHFDKVDGLAVTGVRANSLQEIPNLVSSWKERVCHPVGWCTLI